MSLHSHSGEFCRHAHGTLEDVVKKAVSKGFKYYGLSEHMPRYELEHRYPEEHDMTIDDLVEQFDQYLVKARLLQKQYKSSITLYVGMETEWLTREKIAQLRPKLDYLVGSIHHVYGIPIDYTEALYAQAEAQAGGTEALFVAYFDAMAELMKEFKPEVIGHFDLIRLMRPDFVLTTACWTSIDRCIELIQESHSIVELNSRAYRKGLDEPYPQKSIVMRMKEKNIRFTLGDDAHGPKDVAEHYDKLLAFVHDCSIDEIWVFHERYSIEEVAKRFIARL